MAILARFRWFGSLMRVGLLFLWSLRVLFASNAGNLVFDEQRVAKIAIEVAPEYREQMRKPIRRGYLAEYEYVPASVQFDQQILTNVAVRFKGHDGNDTIPVWEFKIDFNRYRNGFEFDGLKKLNVHTTAI